MPYCITFVCVVYCSLFVIIFQLVFGLLSWYVNK